MAFLYSFKLLLFDYILCLLGCDRLPLWVAANNCILEVNQDKGRNYIIVPTNTSPAVFDIFVERQEVYWAEEKSPTSGSTQIYRYCTFKLYTEDSHLSQMLTLPYLFPLSQT